tara:strand:- start:655 stop:798 length:144 start_codon:yes stop_codon:yes gene_type:complete
MNNIGHVFAPNDIRSVRGRGFVEYGMLTDASGTPVRTDPRQALGAGL